MYIIIMYIIIIIITCVGKLLVGVKSEILVMRMTFLSFRILVPKIKSDNWAKAIALTKG